MNNFSTHFNLIISDGKIDDCPCYAGLDEQLFYNAKYEMIADSFTGNIWLKF